MRFIFIISVVYLIIIYVQSAPQFNGFGLQLGTNNWQWKNPLYQNQRQLTLNENENLNNPMIQDPFDQSMYIQHHRQPKHKGRHMQDHNHQGFRIELSNPVENFFMDGLRQRPFVPFNGPLNGMQMSFPPGPPHHLPHRKHGPPPPPPPPPQKFSYYRPELLQPLPQPPPEFPYHRPELVQQQQQQQPEKPEQLLPRPNVPPHNENNEKENYMEICKEIGEKFNKVSTSGEYGDDNITESTSISTSTIPEQTESTVNEEKFIQSTVNDNDNNLPIETTTEFDWNNYFIGASIDNPGGDGIIDVRGAFA